MIEVHVVGIVSGSISAFLCVVVIAYWLCSPKERTKYNMALVGILSTFDLIMELGIVSDHITGVYFPEYHTRSSLLCRILGLLFYMGLISSWLWATCIAAHLAWLVYNSASVEQRVIPIRYMLAFTYVITILTCFGIAIGDGFGIVSDGDATLCLLKLHPIVDDIPDHGKDATFTYFGVAPIGALFVIIVIFYSYVSVQLYLLLYSSKRKIARIKFKRAIFRTILYPLIFLAVWVTPAVWALYKAINPKLEPKPLLIGAMISVNLSGAVNTLTYFFVKRLITYCWHGEVLSVNHDSDD